MSPALDTAAEKVTEKLAPPVENVLSAEFIHIGDRSVTFGDLVAIGIVLVVTLVVERMLTGLLKRTLRRRGKAGEGDVRALSRVLRYAIWITGGAIAVRQAGIDLTPLFAAGAVFAVAIGFAMQNIVQNFVAGVILLLERAIKPGDVLEVEGQMVKVVEMGIRTTVARTLDDEDLIIPNGVLAQASVKNFTLRDAEYRVRAAVGVAYSSDLDRVREVLAAVTRGLDWPLAEPAPRILLVQFGSSSIDWEVSVWTDDPWRVRSLRSGLLLAIWRALREAGITIAFPQLDLHLDREVVEAIARRQGRDSDIVRDP